MKMGEERIEERLNDIDDDIVDIYNVITSHKNLNEHRFKRTEDAISKLIRYIDKLQDEVHELQTKVRELENR
jgi:predicted nuclease with TOPRIM domain